MAMFTGSGFETALVLVYVFCERSKCEEASAIFVLVPSSLEPFIAVVEVYLESEIPNIRLGLRGGLSYI